MGYQIKISERKNMFFERDFGHFENFGISPIRTRFEPYLTNRRRPEMILLRHQAPTCRPKCQRKMTMEKSNKWTLTIGLSLLPTKAEDLKVSIKDSKLILKGTSLTEQKIGEFGLNSTHEWSKTVEIPSWVDIKTIKVKLNEDKEKIVVNGSKKVEDKKAHEDVIEVSDEEIDVELEELLDAAERKHEKMTEEKDQDDDESNKMKS